MILTRIFAPIMWVVLYIGSWFSIKMEILRGKNGLN